LSSFNLFKRQKHSWTELPSNYSTKMAFVQRIIANASPRLSVFGHYAKAELMPPLSPAELGQVAKGLGDVATSVATGRFLTNTVKESAVKLLIGAEIACWFYAGEVIGKGSLIGYDV